jgi:transcriptional regulator with XRE-family HTH domain
VTPTQPIAERMTEPDRVYLARFGKRIKLLRIDRDLTQEMLAERAGMHRTTIGQLERGRRGISVATLGRLATALDVTPAELLPPVNGSGSVPDPLGAEDPSGSRSPSQPGRLRASRLVLLNPGKAPTPLPEDWAVPDLLDLIAPGGKVAVRDEPGGPVAGSLTRESGRATGPVIELVAVGICNPRQPPFLAGETGAYLSIEDLWNLVAPGGFACMFSLRPGERPRAGIDVRQRITQWLNSSAATGAPD